MTHQHRRFLAILLCALLALQGCAPRHPFYLGGHNELNHYLSVATEIEYPDVYTESLAETTLSAPPLTLAHSEPDELWDLTLEEAIQITLHNSKVIKSLGGVRVVGGTTSPTANTAATPTTLSRSATAPDAVRTVYDPALRETNTTAGLQGVESALADFDAQLATSIFWARTERPQNINAAIPPGLFAGTATEESSNFSAELSKKAATGATFFFRNLTNYSGSNALSRSVPSQYETMFEAEVAQPLLRGAGVEVNRVPVLLARIRTDVSLTDFECAVRDLVGEVESNYWECYYSWRGLNAAKKERDSLFKLWQFAELKERVGGGSRLDEAQIRQRYFQARGITETALNNVFTAESKLRYLMGLAATDGRLIRPIDEPATVRVNFDWHDIMAETLMRNCSLRIKRWQIKQRELEMVTARNQLLPQLDGTALYRWYGAGDDLWGNGGPAFPAAGSHAGEELFRGDYQEWRLGLSMNLPIGFRRELAGVRHAQLQLARAHALLDETELELIHQLTDMVRQKDAAYLLAQTTYNTWIASDYEVKTMRKSLELGGTTTDVLLDSISRLASAEATYYRNLTNYNVAVSQIHAIKGSLLELNNVWLAEGPWPAKAYFDAEHQARKRAASHYFDYGMSTKPAEISAGPVDQFMNQGEVISPQLLPPVETSEPIETPPAVSPLPEPQTSLPPRNLDVEQVGFEQASSQLVPSSQHWHHDAALPTDFSPPPRIHPASLAAENAATKRSTQASLQQMAIARLPNIVRVDKPQATQSSSAQPPVWHQGMTRPAMLSPFARNNAVELPAAPVEATTQVELEESETKLAHRTTSFNEHLSSQPQPMNVEVAATPQATNPAPRGWLAWLAGGLLTVVACLALALAVLPSQFQASWRRRLFSIPS